MVTGKSPADFPGAFIPFDKPVGPVPAGFITDSPTVQICINEAWLPYVLTCLKALGRPETWLDSWDNIQRAASEMSALIASQSDGCGLNVPGVLCISGSFKDLDYGFVASSTASCPAVWSSGVGWFSCHDTTDVLDECYVERTLTSSTFLRKYAFELAVPWAVVFEIIVECLFEGTIVQTDEVVQESTGTFNFAHAVNKQVDLIRVKLSHGALFFTNTLTITDFELCYTGDFPLSDTPPVVCRVFDFAGSDQGFAVWSERPYGHWSSGGWLPTANQVGNSSIYISKVFDFSGTVTNVRIEGAFQFSDGNEVGGSHEFNDNFNRIPGSGSFVVDLGAINWHVTAGERWLTVILNSTHHPSNMLLTKFSICSTPAVFS